MFYTHIQMMTDMSYYKKKQLKSSFKTIVCSGHYLYYSYYWMYTIIMDLKFSKRVLSKTIFNDNESMYPVQCLSYPYIIELFKKVRFDSRDVFVDIGCAWGRLIGYLEKRTPIKKFIGIEINVGIAREAKDIFKNYNNVSIIEGDVLDYIPLEATIFYLFNPFNADILDLFLYKIEDEIDHPVTLMYLYPTCKEVFKKHNRYWFLSEIIELKPKYYGSLNLYIYKFNPKQ